MGMWDIYESRFGDGHGITKRESNIDHTMGRLWRNLSATLSYQKVIICGVERQIAIIDDTEFNVKKIYSMPGEDLPHGEIVKWDDTLWLITEKNHRNEVYTEGKMVQCNYYLKWIDEDGNIIGRWCVVEDGTKYLTGERSEDIMSIGDARIAVTIGKDLDTDKLYRGRRFLIDDMDSKEVLAYEISKPNKLYNVYNGMGVFRFILTEVNLTDDDNCDLRIADYYSWKPKIDRPKPDTKTDNTLEEIVSDALEKKDQLPVDEDEKKVWI